MFYIYFAYRELSSTNLYKLTAQFASMGVGYQQYDNIGHPNFIKPYAYL